MTRYTSQEVAQFTTRQKFKLLGQPTSVYDEWVSSDPEHQEWVISLLDTILIKGYLPA